MTYSCVGVIWVHCGGHQRVTEGTQHTEIPRGQGSKVFSGHQVKLKLLRGGHDMHQVLRSYANKEVKKSHDGKGAGRLRGCRSI